LVSHNRLSISENKVLSNIVGTQKDAVTANWRILNSEELHNLYSSLHIIQAIITRKMKWAGHVARMGERRGAYSILVGKPWGKRPLGRPRHRRDDYIKMDLQKLGWRGGGGRA
jgi:hypothetical protein